ncbi:MAG: hypothetical protein HQ534_08360 [Armatimonadetes bacterium]|nr:hypothetical protein [Armatimonadota bacterium]
MSEQREKRSFEYINYMFRPKKQIERKIITEILQELKEEINLSKYLYIGFGSIYYYDFILFHKILNMNNLLSIDDKSTKKRFEFNRPYDFISFENKISTDFLNEYDWKQNSVLWLDYDNKLENIVLSDIKIIAKNCKKKDFLMITVNSYCGSVGDERDKARENFYNEFGMYISSDYYNKKYYTPKYFPYLLQEVILKYLMAVSELQNISFCKLFSFRYRDGAPMFTIGGIFDDDKKLYNRKWDNKFISTDEEVKDINVPILTYCEKFHIDSHIEKLKRKIKKIESKNKESGRSLIEKEMTEMMNKTLPFELASIYDLKNYIEFYRYYPQYYEGII